MNCNDNYKNTLQKIKLFKCCRQNRFLLGPTGPTGPQGATGEILDFADFYALMPPDNAATVAPGTDVEFPQDGPGADLEYNVVGRATGTAQIIDLALVTTTSVNSILTVQNSSGNAATLTITPNTGGTRSVSAHLVIIKIQ